MFVRRRVSLSFKDVVSSTRQEFKDQADVNNIIARHSRHLIDNFDPASWQSVDLTVVPGYEQAYEIVLAAQQSFMTLPANVRAQFDNDPGLFFSAYNDPGNELIRELGLKPPKSASGSVSASSGAAVEAARKKSSGEAPVASQDDV